MTELINQISIGCAVNSAIINDVLNKRDFTDSCVNIPLKHNIKPPIPGMPWPFQNSSWEAYKLYCMLVVPKELYKLPEEDEFYKDLSAKNVMRNFAIKKQRKSFQESPLYHFNSLRNSISHVNYSLNKEGDFTMWDHPPRKIAEEFWHWHVEISKVHMYSFLGEMAEAIFKIYNEINQGLRDSITYAQIS
jgi:hypothetical protein